MDDPFATYAVEEGDNDDPTEADNLALATLEKDVDCVSCDL